MPSWSAPLLLVAIDAGTATGAGIVDSLHIQRDGILPSSIVRRWDVNVINHKPVATCTQLPPKSFRRGIPRRWYTPGTRKTCCKDPSLLLGFGLITVTHGENRPPSIQSFVCLLVSSMPRTPSIVHALPCKLN